MLTSFVVGNTCIRESLRRQCKGKGPIINLNIRSVYDRRYMQGDYVVAPRIDSQSPNTGRVKYAQYSTVM